MLLKDSLIVQIFFELIQISIGKKEGFSQKLSAREWDVLYVMAVKQSLAGVLFEGMNNILSKQREIKPSSLYEWYGIQLQSVEFNRLQNEKSKELYSFFWNRGYKCCIIKGQGTARLYPQPELRQSGDIDIWVEGGHKKVVHFLRDQYIGLSFIDYVNCHAAFYNDIEVEVHFRPTYMYNPFINRRLQKWLEKNKYEQMDHFDDDMGFSYPTIKFNLVFSLIHIYRHIFSEGVGLRQLMDYYYILKHSTEDDRKVAYSVLRSFRLGKLVSAVMYIMKKVFLLDDSYLLCTVCVDEGEFLLEEILRGGNFGQYDDRRKRTVQESRFQRGLANMKRNARFFKHYPNEVILSPLWKGWHWCWRKSNGYL